MEGRAAMRMTLVLALCFFTFLASKQHYIGADARTAPSPGSAGRGGGGGVLTVFTPSPSPDVSICSDADCKADSIDELKGEYSGSQCVEVDQGVVCVCFTKD
ncbi:hypothetical protein ACFX2J_040978 [Malus domestica]